MNTKIADLFVLGVITIMGVGYSFSAINFKENSSPSNIGPGYFPLLLGVALIILCIISMIQTILKKEIIKIKLPHLKLILLTIVITSLFLISWSVLGYFYINLFILFFILFSLYTQQFNKNIILKSSALSIILSIFVYFIFDLLLKINL